jgi:hypothetical protein
LAENAKAGSVWSDEELDLIVADYFAMLASEQAGVAYVKSHHASRLIAATGRSHRSVEFKHMNISAVLQEIGQPIIRGYKPAANYQKSILDAIERWLTRPAALWFPEPVVGASETALPYLEAAPILQPPRPRPAELERLVRKFDAGERDFRNRELGKAGEEAVLLSERQKLRDAERADLARTVRWVAQEDGDGAGYDILSFDTAGQELLLEVKTTLGGATTPFYLTRNEFALAEERTDAFRLRRVYSFAREPRMFELAPPLAESVRLSPHTFLASFG